MRHIPETPLKIVLLVIVWILWFWIFDYPFSSSVNLLILVGSLLLVYPVVWLGRWILDKNPTVERAAWITTFVHYGVGFLFGASIIRAIVTHQDWRVWVLPIPSEIGLVLVVVTGIALLFTVINLALKGLGAPFAISLSQKLAVDWSYAWTRNPMVLAALALLVSLGIWYQSVLFILWALLLFAPSLLTFVKVYEERELEIRFGVSYLEYKTRTPFLLPKRPGNQRMPISPEDKIRAGLPIVRFMQTWIPLPVSHWLLKQGMARLRLGADLTRESASADGVPCEWIIPRNCQSDRVLLYLHGGGFVFGLTPPHVQMAAWLAGKMGIRILMVDYRLAPEYPFPAALDDCVTAYCWLLKQGFSAKNMAVAGDSAGGNLTVTSLMKLRNSSIPLPAAAACLSPVTDLTDKKDRLDGFKDPLLPPSATKFYSESYAGHSDAHTPLISPMFGDLRGLPPLLIHAGEDEILREDALRLADLAKASGVDVRLEIYPRMWHVWQINLALPQAIHSLDDIAQFLTLHLEISSL